MIDFLEIFYPAGPWKEARVRRWLNKPAAANIEDVLRMIYKQATSLYDRRAAALQKDHPLALQVNLATGVANGVLVVRSAAGCAKVLRMVLTRSLDFDIEETPSAYLLRERTTHSVYRTVTKDRHLTNAFWNFYRESV